MSTGCLDGVSPSTCKYEKTNCENVHLEEWGEVAVSFNRGPWFGAMNWTEGETKHHVILEFTTPSWSAGTKGLCRGRAFMLPKTQEEFAKIDWSDPRPRLIKIHGSVEDRQSMAVTFAAVEGRGLSRASLEAIRYVFSTGKHEDVLVLGYSGRSPLHDLLLPNTADFIKADAEHAVLVTH